MVVERVDVSTDFEQELRALHAREGRRLEQRRVESALHLRQQFLVFAATRTNAQEGEAAVLARSLRRRVVVGDDGALSVGAGGRGGFVHVQQVLFA